MQMMARAKINLALHVTGQREDGYHLLDTLVSFAEIGDKLSFETSDQLELTISGSEAGNLQADAENLVLGAANLLRNHVGAPGLGASIHLEKNLPVASGIGGGSADAAAALVGLCRLWKLDLDDRMLHTFGLSLGADVPMCLLGKPARVTGIGDIIQPIEIAPVAVVLANPRVAVSTAQVFNSLTNKNNPPADDFHTEDGSQIKSISAYLLRQRNDLQRAAVALAPAIRDCLSALESFSSCRLARMSGSGATCFGLFETPDAAAEAALQMRQDHPDWWVVNTATIG